MKNWAQREVVQLTASDCFLVMDRKKDYFDTPLHYHPEFELNFIRRGRGLLRRVGDHSEEIGDCELVLVGPNLEHCWDQYHYQREEAHEITVQFHNHLFGKPFLDKDIMGPIGDMLKRSARGILFSEATFHEVGPNLKRISKLDGMAFFLEMMSVLHGLAVSSNQRILSNIGGPVQPKRNNEKLNVLDELLHGSFQSKLTLEEIASHLNMSKVSFNRFMKKSTGKTFVEYLNDIRIGHAIKMLVESDMDISDVALRCGFNSLANFNRTFKKLQECTPSKYRSEFTTVQRVYSPKEGKGTNIPFQHGEEAMGIRRVL
ncbi:MAG: helix-turn-helix domain-containing protein [Flavobacteriaceae bacterium]